MRVIRQTAQFKRDLKKASRTYGAETLIKLFAPVLIKLADDEILPPEYRDHALTGKLNNFRDCHIKPDLILIYRKIGDDMLSLVRLGSHSELGI